MEIKDLLTDLDAEIETIQSSGFDIQITETLYVPSDADPSLTFENFDAEFKKVKTIETCVLYVDIRESTKLNLTHNPHILAKLYSSFIRGMIKAAENYDGKIRNIVGDRVMVVFDSIDCFTKSINTAILINTICKKIINKRFTQDVFKCGVGIDYGKMMIAKCGTIKQGEENSYYKSLVWLGRPANIASKLTDNANQLSTNTITDGVEVGFHYRYSDQWIWQFKTINELINNIEFSLISPDMHYKDDNFVSFISSSKSDSNYDSTPPILITDSVYKGFKNDNPNDDSIKNGWWKKMNRKIPEFSSAYYGGDITFNL